MDNKTHSLWRNRQILFRIFQCLLIGSMWFAYSYNIGAHDTYSTMLSAVYFYSLAMLANAVRQHGILSELYHLCDDRTRKGVRRAMSKVETLTYSERKLFEDQ